MNSKIFITAILLLISTITVQAQNNLFTKLSDNDDVTTVYISKTLLQMVPNMASKTDVGGANMGDLINKLDQLEIYTSEKAGVADMMKNEADKFIKNKTYESLMTVKDGKDNVNFLISTDKKKEAKELIMIVTTESRECTIIRILGNFTMQDIQKFMANNKDK